MSEQWKRVQLGDVLRRVERFERREELTEYQFAGTYSFARGIFVSERKLGATFKLPKVQRIKSGDFVYCKIMAWEGAFGVVPPAADDCVLSGAFIVYEIDLQRVEPSFLAWYFKSPDIWQRIGRQSSGTNVRRQSLHPRQFEAAEIPLPNLQEQHRIVSHIEELAAMISEGRAIRSQLLDEIRVVEESILTSVLPSDIPVEPLGDLISPDSTISYGVLVPGPDVEEGVPFVRVQDLDPRHPAPQPVKRISPGVEASYGRTRLRGGEVLIGVVGSIGKVGIVPDSWAGANIARAVCRIVPGERLTREFLVQVLMSKRTQDYFRDVTRTLAQPTLNVKQLAQTPIPVPPIEEQEAIVRRLEQLQSKVRSIAGLQSESAAELDAFLPAILDRAFKGEL